MLASFVPILATAALTSGSAFALRDGDRVVFYGDSITEQKFYTTYVEDWVATRRPDLDVDFVNAGWGSDTVAGGFGGPIATRLSRDVIARRPTVVTVMLGMNDGQVKPWSVETAGAFEAGYQGILDGLKKGAPGARVTLIGPSPYDDVTRPPTFPGGYNGVLMRFGAFLAVQARARGHAFVDFNAPVAAMLARAQGLDPALAPMLISDRIHPSAGTQWVMAAALLSAWGATPEVSRVALSAAGGKLAVDAAAGTKVTVTGPLAWTQLDRGLPMPVERADERVKLALRASDVEARLNRQPLAVAGLAPGSWEVAIDGAPVGRWDAAALGAGVDLAALDTPMVRQAQAVHKLTIAHQAVRFARWRGLEVGPSDWPSPARDVALRAATALDADLLARRKAAAQPRPRRYVLRKV